MSADKPEFGPRIEAAAERSIAAQQIGSAYTGDVVLPAEALQTAERATAAPGTSNLPPAPLCLGRQEELTWLRRTLTDQRESAITQSGTVHGLGGVGKSTLALHYAHRHRGDYTLIWWINAASPDEIETSLTILTQTLVPGWAATAERGAQVAWAKQWLAWHPGWLLVYDNVDNPDDLAPYTGALHQGHHLATSRRAIGWPDTAPTLTLGNLHPNEATNLLCRLVFKETTPTPRQQADARALTADLGYLPLAIKQAGAYLAQNRGISLDAYHRRLDTKLAKTAHGIDAERTIARIWSVTLHALEKDNPLAVEVLYTAAWFAPDDIPHTLLTASDTDPDDTAEAIGTLAAYSMVIDTGATLSVHRLVQTVLRAPQNTQHSWHLQGRDRAEQAVLHHLAPPSGRVGTSDSRWDIFAPHLVTLAATTPPGRRCDALIDTYNTAADHLCEHGQIVRAIPLFEAVLAHHEQVLGDTHPSTLTSRHNVATGYKESGRLEHSISLFETTVAQREQVLGTTHPDTLSSRNNLASAYLAAGNWKRAIPLFETILAQRKQVLDEAHPDTLLSRSQLAAAYTVAGDLERAIPLLEAALAQRSQVLGDTHPETLLSRNNLASAYQQAGDMRRAIPLLETTVAQYEQLLGEAHPSTLVSRNNLAYTYQEAGDFGRGIRLLEATLTQCERVLGDTHPHTLVSRNNLAQAYVTAGNWEYAIPLLEASLAQREQVLGTMHPGTLTSRNNLACAYARRGDLGRAIHLWEATLSQRKQVLGDTHPETLQSRNNLAYAYQEMGDLTRALPLLEAAFAQCVRTLGDTHPHTLASRNNLACAYAEAGDFGQAIPLFKATLAQREQALGKNHPDTLISRRSLASARRAAQALQQPGTTPPSTASAQQQLPETFKRRP